MNSRDSTPQPIFGRDQKSYRLTAGDVMTAAEVAELLHVPESTVGDWARRGVIPSRKIGRRRIYIHWQIQALLEDHDNSPTSTNRPPSQDKQAA